MFDGGLNLSPERMVRKIIADNPREAEAIAAEKELSQAKARNAEITKELTTFKYPFGPGKELKYVALSRELEKLQDLVIPQLRQKVLAYRYGRGSTLRAVLSPVIAEAAQRAL